MYRTSRAATRRGFTLIELLVVIVIIGMLLAMLFPAVQAARVSARNSTSKNNLRQISLAMANHESAKGHYPASWLPVEPVGDNVDGWSVFAQLLPYLEQEVTSSNIDYTQSYNLAADVVTADGATTKISALRVPTYLSPAEPRDEVRFDGGAPKHYPINYAVNLGTWLVWDPSSNTGGNGAAYPDSRLNAGHFRDGLSSTLAMAEVKGWQAYYRNAGASAGEPIPTSIADSRLSTGDFKTNSGHTEWVDGRAHQIGFTTVFPPNTQVLRNEGGVDYDIDWTSWQEGKGMGAASPTLTPTYAAVTARSYFSGMVNVSMMDGSVRAIDNEINLGVWRAISTRNGEETLPDSFNK